jgi:hypothetical protein
MKYKLYIPENFDLNKLKLVHNPEFNFHDYKVFYILNLMYIIPCQDNLDFESLKDWVPINTTLLQEVGIRDFPKYKEWLIKCGVLECDESYTPNEQSRLYKFTTKYKTKISGVYINKKSFINKISEMLTPFYNDALDNAELSIWFLKLRIDKEKSLRHLERKYIEDKKQDEIKANNKFNSGKINVERINDGVFFFNIDQTSGRLHTNLTNLQSDLRNFITYNGEKLVSLDFRNSQPFMGLCLFSEKFWNNKVKTQITINTILNNTTNNLTINTPTPLMLAEMKSSDIDSYISLVCSGMFYDKIQEEMLNCANPITFKSRRELKSKVFSVIYAKNHYTGRIKTFLEENFHNVMSMFSFIKKDNYKTLSLLLQSIESELFVNRFAKRISERGIVLFTIHDSIVTTLENEIIVKEIMLEEAERSIGYLPTIHNDYWRSNSAIV